MAVENGKDERLQTRDQDRLEQVDGDADRQREPAEDLQAEDTASWPAMKSISRCPASSWPTA